MNIAIRANGGTKIGLGHVHRCLALAQSLRQIGAKVRFILNDDSAVRKWVCLQGFEAVSVRADHDLEDTVDALHRGGLAALVTDFYDLNTDDWIALRKHVHLLVAIDDLSGKHLPVDIVVNTTANAPTLKYSALAHTRFLIGPAYSLLREEFAQEPASRMRDVVERVLITVGGSDPLRLTPRLVRWVLEAMDGVLLDVVVGPFFDSTQAIEGEKERCPLSICLHYGEPDIRELMLQADIAVTGGGQTTYELAATSTPAVAICLAENQRGSLAALALPGVLILAGDANDPNIEAKLKHILRSLALDPDRRTKMRAVGRMLVDGLGARRVAQAIKESFEQKLEGRL